MDSINEKNSQRRYLPTLGELLDRLCITQLKEVRILDHKKEYTEEIGDILHDIQLILDEKKFEIDANFLRNVIILSQNNQNIWENEKSCRSGNKEGNDLYKS